MKKVIIASAYLLATVSAGSLWARDTAAGQLDHTGALGFLQPGEFGTRLPDDEEKESQQLFEDAGRNPNDTSSTTFNFAPDSLSGSSTWMWRLNITDVAVPEQIFDRLDLHVVNNQWELQWLGGVKTRMGDSSTGNATVRDICITAAEINAPSNITSRYSEPGNCSAVLGSECYSKFLAAVTSSSCAVTPNFLESGIEECQDTLIGGAGSGSISTTFTNTSDFISSEPGNVVFFDTSSAVEAANLSNVFTQAETRLNILLLRTNNGASSAMICQVVNPAAVSNGLRLRIDGYTILAVVAFSSALILL